MAALTSGLPSLGLNPQALAPRPAAVSTFPTNFEARKSKFRIIRPQANDQQEMEVSAEMRRNYMNGQNADNDFLRRARFELDFLQNHWIEEETGQDLRQRLWGMGRSAFQSDLITPSMDVIINQIRINKTSVKFVPLDPKANQATAEVRQGLYRDIERVSKAAIARETAYQFAVSVGRGYWRITIEDEPGPTFAQRIGMQRIDNLNSVIIDPTCLDFTYSDAGWACIWETFDREYIRAEYGDAIADEGGSLFPMDFAGVQLQEQERNLFFPRDKMILVEYFRKRWKKRRVVELADGSGVWLDELEPGTQLPPGYRFKDKMDWDIEYRKMSGTQTIEKRIWPGKYIPIVVCVGREIFRGNKPKLHSGLIRPAIDPARCCDAATSRMLDELMLSPLPHMLADEDALDTTNEKIVNEINVKPWSVVKYKTKSLDGKPLPPPAWSSPGVNTGPAVQAAELMANRQDRVLSVYAPQRGQPVGDMSGKAMQEIKAQGDTSHAAFPDNYQRAMFEEAVIVNDLMDSGVYSDKQALTITMPDDQTRAVLINQEYQDPKTGKMVKHVFGEGRYGIILNTAPYYPGEQAERADRLLQLAKMFPQQMALALDLMIKDLNLAHAEKYEERVRPPGVQSEDDQDGPTYQQLAQSNQELMQNGQEAQGLIEKLLAKIDEMGTGEALKRLDIASKERMKAGELEQGILLEAMRQEGAQQMEGVKQSAAGSMEVLRARVQNILSQLEEARTLRQIAASGGEPGGTPQPAAGA